MNFKDYLAKRRVRNDPQGTFTADALADPQLPDMADWGHLQRYLLRRGQGHVIDVARLVWAGYRAKLWRDRKRMAASSRMP
ncbi:MAG: hypothetical protein ACK4HW_06320 [Roseinatronobacter sp.]